MNQAPPLSVTLPQEAEPEPRSPAVSRVGVIGLAAGLVLFCGAGLLLWARYGATVFFDLLSAGFAACF